MPQLLDVFNLNYFGGPSDSPESESDRFSIVMEFNLGHCVAHETPDSPGVVQAEEGLADTVQLTHGHEHIQHINAEDSESVFNAGLFYFKRHKFSLLAVL